MFSRQTRGRGEEEGATKKGLTVHPLFFLVGILSAFTGSLFSFLSACAAALEHECAHALVARRYGYRLNRIVLMPYGAVLSGDLTALTPREELCVAAAGPIANALTACAFAALWWFFPDTYPYTEAAATVSLSLFLVNLLPAYPLDGGRMLGVALRPLGGRRRGMILRGLNILVSLAVFVYFVFSCFSRPNLSALLFACLLFAGAFGGGSYTKLTFPEKRKLKKGVEERRIVLSADCTLKEGLRFLREDRYTVFVLYDGGEFLGEMEESEYLSALQTRDYSCPMRNCLTEFLKET